MLCRSVGKRLCGVSQAGPQASTFARHGWPFSQVLDVVQPLSTNAIPGGNSASSYDPRHFVQWWQLCQKPIIRVGHWKHAGGYCRPLGMGDKVLLLGLNQVFQEMDSPEI
jgi:hypothetical protein